MNVSLIVATCGRHTEVERLLASLARQSYTQFHTIIVDQNPPGYLADVIAPYMDRLSLEVLTTEPQGVSAARNVGLLYTTGDIVAFPDDDCWYLPDTIEHVVALFCKHTELGGLVVAWDDRDSPQKFQKILWPVTLTNAFQGAGTLVQFYRKEALEGVLYDPVLGPGTGLPYGCGEDTDFLLQVLKKGRVVKRTEDVLVGHPKPNIHSRELISKTYAYARGRMYLLRKHHFSFWFRVLNVLYPLSRLVLDGPKLWRYRWAMFWGRLKSF